MGYKVTSTQLDVSFILVKDNGTVLVKNTIDEVAEHVFNNPTETKWITAPAQIITGVESF